ncbi:MAG TPA: hypothetical protein DEB39_03165 [Planctomycetaceae bacterium]|nr:hypothetical protein [Planctomycetaceae bacterium]
MYDPTPYQVDLTRFPEFRTAEVPGPRSRELHRRMERHLKGFSDHVRLFPAAFEKGYGCLLEDADENVYIDFSGGVHVTTLGHCHPKISEAIARYASRLMNAHDFASEIKVRLLEKLAQTLPGDFTGFQLYDAGTVAVENGLRLARAITGRQEFVGGFTDFHGKTGHAAGISRTNIYSGPSRAPGFYMLPRPDLYRPWWTRSDGTPDTEKYLEYYAAFLKEGTTGQVAAFVLEPIQGWAGSVIPADDFFPKLKPFLEKRGILLFADEILTGFGRTGSMLCMEHWDVLPDIVTLGKGFGNGFPVTALAVRREYEDFMGRFSAGNTYGGNPMACAAALASMEVIEEESLLEHARDIEAVFRKRTAAWTGRYRTLGDVRVKGCLAGLEFVKDKTTKEPFPEVGERVYMKAARNGVVCIPAGSILRISPAIVIPEDVLIKGLDIIEEAIAETEAEPD